MISGIILSLQMKNFGFFEVPMLHGASE